MFLAFWLVFRGDTRHTGTATLCALGARSPASEPASGKKWQPRPHPRLNSMSCSPAPSDVSGCFILVDKEGPARERQLQKLLARSGDGTVVVVMCTVVSKMYTQDVTAVSEMYVHDLASVT